MEDNGTVFALRDPNGFRWESVPPDVRQALQVRLDELRSHKSALLEPSISNIQAVSAAIAQLGTNVKSIRHWIVALETIMIVIDNVVKHPKDPKYYRINTSNNVFHQKIGHLANAVDILIALGFREDENSALVLPIDSEVTAIEARKLELEVGLELLRSRKARLEDVASGLEVKEKEGKAKSAGANRAKSPSTSRSSSAPKPTESAPDQDARRLNNELSKTIKDERDKRMKAEAAVLSQKTFMAELQQQLFQLQKAEAHSLSLRQGLTISRLTNEEKAAFSSEIVSLTGGIVPSNENVNNGTNVIPQASSAVALSTSLTGFCGKGSSKLPLASIQGTKKGMSVLIGSGSSGEVVKIIAISNDVVAVAPSLLSNFNVGTPIRAFKVTAKTTTAIQSVLGREIAREVLLEDVVAPVCELGEQRLLDNAINAEYGRRRVMKHLYTVDAHSPIEMADSSSAKSISASTGVIVAISRRGLSFIDPSITAVQLVCAFHNSCEDKLADDYAVVDSLIEYVQADNVLFGAFQELGRLTGCSDVHDLFTHYASGSNRLGWESYLRILKSMEINQSLASPRLKQSDPSSLLLHRQFTVLDVDNDNLIAMDDVLRAFAELDGCIAGLDSVVKVVKKVTGDYDSGIKFSFVDFVALRHEYAREVSTLAAGVCLHGRLLVSSVSARDDREGVSFERQLPSQLLESVFLPLALSMRDSIRERNIRTKQELTQLLDHSRYCSNKSSLQYTSSSAVFDNIFSATFDKQGDHIYALDFEGNLQVVSAATGEVKCRRRVIYAEAKPSRPIESCERFLRWLDESGYSNTEEQFNEAESISIALSKFVLSSPIASDMLVVDDQVGLILVNNCLNSGSLTFYDSVSLRRVYRIPAPSSKLSVDVDNAISEIHNGGVPSKVSNFSGAVSKIVLLGRQCLLVCSLLHSQNILVLNSLNGDVIVRLRGHIQEVSCLRYEPALGAIFSGSMDCAVRMWRLADCVPQFETSGVVTEDVLTGRLESTLFAHGSKFGRREMSGAKDLARKLLRKLDMSVQSVTATVIGLFDARDYFVDKSREYTGVEILFPNGLVKSVSNTSTLRRPNALAFSSFSVGEQIDLSHVDPIEAAQMFARRVGVELTGSFCSEEIIDMFQRCFPTEPEATSGIAASLLLDSKSKHSLLSVFLGLFLYDDKSSNFCERILQGAHQGTIVDVHLCEGSHLIVTIDRFGVCCIWDPLSACVSLLSTGSLQWSYNGFRLVGQTNVMCSRKSSASGLMALAVRQDDVLSAGTERNLVLRALSLTAKVGDNGGRLIQGFLYVSRSFDVESIQTACFLPGLLDLDSEIDSSGSGDAMAQLRRLKTSRDIVRIIYFVSALHDRVDAVVRDLQLYGVIHKGHMITPTDRLQVVCFERMAGSSKNARPLPRQEMRSRSGVLVSLSKEAVRVALDYCNEVVEVEHSKITYASVSPMGSSDDSKSGDASLYQCIGSRVRFDEETKSAQDSHAVVDVLFVKLCDASSETLVPLTITRSSFECSAADISSVEITAFELDNVKILSRHHSEESLGRFLSRALVRKTHHTTRESIYASIRQSAAMSIAQSSIPLSTSLQSLFQRQALPQLMSSFLLLSSSLEVSLNHPLMRHFKSCLGVDHAFDSDLISASDILELFYVREGLSTNDICSYSSVFGVSDVDAFATHLSADSTLLSDAALVRKLLEYISRSRRQLVQDQFDLPFQKHSDDSTLAALAFQVELEMRFCDHNRARDPAFPAHTDAELLILKLILKAVSDCGCVTDPAAPPSLVDVDRRLSSASGVYSVKRVDALSPCYQSVGSQRICCTDEDMSTATFLLLSPSHASEGYLSSMKDVYRELKVVGLAAIAPEEAKLATVKLDGANDGLLLSVDEDAVLLSSLVSSIGSFLAPQRLMCFRKLTDNIYSSLTALQSKSYSLYSLSPATVAVSKATCDVMLIPTPLWSTPDSSATETHRSAYASFASSNPMLSACLPPEDPYSSSSDTWAFGAILFQLAFCFPYVPPKSAQNVVSAVWTSLLDHVSEKAPTPFAPSALSVASHFSSHKFLYLSSFYEAFLVSCTSAGLSTRSASSTWEKLLQSVYTAMDGSSESYRVKRKLNYFPVGISEDAVTRYFEESFGLDLNETETKALLSSVAGDAPQASTTEKFVKLLKLFTTSLLEIEVYGSFQQVLAIVCKCLAPNHSDRVHLAELKSMTWFNCCPVVDVVPLSMDFVDALAYVRSMIQKPLIACLTSSLSSSSDLSVAAVSYVLTECENVLFMVSARLNGKADESWLGAHAAEVLSCMSVSQCLEQVTFLVIRLRRSSADTGSELVTRFLKFLKYAVVMLSLIPSVPTTATEALAVEFDAFHLHSAVHLWIDSLLQSLLMCYLGEETPVRVYGSCADTLSDARFIPSLLPIQTSIRIENKWDSQFVYWVEPLLLDLLGENGAGTKKMHVVLDRIRQKDHIVALFCPGELDTTFHRSSFYFQTLFKVCRCIASCEQAPKGKGGKEKALLMLSTVLAVVSSAFPRDKVKVDSLVS